MPERRRNTRFLLILGLVAMALISILTLAGPGSDARAQDRSITLASTTSTANSGLFAHLLPIFEAEAGITVHVVAVGTGQAINLARNGDADVLLVHHRPSEEAFVAAGFGLSRHDLMYNDFVLVGPRADPAAVDGMTDIAAALSRIAEARAVFVSRGDDSGTHKKELELWRSAAIDPNAIRGDWYRALGAGMGAALNIAAEINAYSLTDRATWVAFQNKGDLAILSQGAPTLHNPYGVILVDPDRYRHVHARDGQIFIDWLLSPRGQAAIGQYRVNGQQLFFSQRISTRSVKAPPLAGGLGNYLRQDLRPPMV